MKIASFEDILRDFSLIGVSLRVGSTELYPEFGFIKIAWLLYSISNVNRNRSCKNQGRIFYWRCLRCQSTPAMIQDIEFVILNKITRIVNCAATEIPNIFEAEGILYTHFNWVEGKEQVCFVVT
jgi:hypothetical protein